MSRRLILLVTQRYFGDRVTQQQSFSNIFRFPQQLRFPQEKGDILKPWSNGPASSRKCSQVELTQRLALGGQTHWQVSSKVHASRKIPISRQTTCISLAKNPSMDVTQLALTWVGWPNGEKLALTCKFDLDQNERKSSQVNASARKPWPNGVASRPKFSTCVYLRVRLARALL